LIIQEKTILSNSQQRLQKRCKYLSKDLKDSYNAKPSDRVYFGRYPYKVTLHLTKDLESYVKTMMTGYSPPKAFVDKLEESPDSFDFHMALHLRRMEDNQAWRFLQDHKEYVRDLDKPPFYGERFYIDIHKHNLMCYLPDLTYTKDVCNKYGNNVAEVHGPWNKKHVDMLIDHNTSIAVRDKPYWNKYNIKVSARPSYQSGAGAWNKRTELVEKLRDFFKQNTDPDSTRFQRHRYGEVNLWTTDNELLSIEPFLQLAYPDTRLHVTRCFTYK